MRLPLQEDELHKELHAPKMNLEGPVICHTNTGTKNLQMQ
jgi:hypothetical protein